MSRAAMDYHRGENRSSLRMGQARDATFGEIVRSANDERIAAIVIPPGEFPIYEHELDAYDSARDSHIKVTIFKFNREDHTLGNLLVSRLRKNPQVEFAAYKIDHPHHHNFELRVQLIIGPEAKVGYRARDAVCDACLEIVMDLKCLGARLTQEMCLYKMAHGEEEKLAAQNRPVFQDPAFDSHLDDSQREKLKRDARTVFRGYESTIAIDGKESADAAREERRKKAMRERERMVRRSQEQPPHRLPKFGRNCGGMFASEDPQTPLGYDRLPPIRIGSPSPVHGGDEAQGVSSPLGDRAHGGLSGHSSAFGPEESLPSGPSEDSHHSPAPSSPTAFSYYHPSSPAQF